MVVEQQQEQEEQQPRGRRQRKGKGVAQRTNFCHLPIQRVQGERRGDAPEEEHEVEEEKKRRTDRWRGGVRSGGTGWTGTDRYRRVGPILSRRTCECCVTRPRKLRVLRRQPGHVITGAGSEHSRRPAIIFSVVLGAGWRRPLCLSLFFF